MNKRKFLFLIIVICLAGLTAEAASRACENLFEKLDIRQAIERVDQKNNLFLLEGKDLSEYSSSYSKLRQRRIRKLLQKVDLQKMPSQRLVERYAIELSEALFGSSKSFGRWIFKNKEERLEDSTVRLIKEKLLIDGLVRTWGQSRDPVTVSIFKKTLALFSQFLSSPVGQLLQFPIILPSIRNRTLPSDFVFKVIRDGFKVHANEAQVLLKAQTRIEAYNTFRRVYAPTAFAALFAASSITAYHNLEATTDQMVKETVTQLEQSRVTLEKQIPETKQEIFNQAYNGMVEEFIKKYNEPPTEAEKILIKEKIRQALAM